MPGSEGPRETRVQLDDGGCHHTGAILEDSVHAQGGIVGGLDLHGLDAGLNVGLLAEFLRVGGCADVAAPWVKGWMLRRGSRRAGSACPSGNPVASPRSAACPPSACFTHAHGWPHGVLISEATLPRPIREFFSVSASMRQHVGHDRGGFGLSVGKNGNKIGTPTNPDRFQCPRKRSYLQQNSRNSLK